MKMRHLETIREFELILESTFTQLRQMRLTPVELIDESLMEDAAEMVSEIASQATFFNYPGLIPSRTMLTPLNGMRIVGRILAWVRAEMLRESPFLDIRQAMRYVGATSEKQIYGAIERGRLESLKVGKELRFTTEMLERFLQQ